METYEIDILALSVLGNLEKIDKAEETGLSRQTRSDIEETDRLDGIHFDFTFLHLVSVADFDMRAFPDSNAARDFATPNPLPKTLRKHHDDEFTLTSDARFPFSQIESVWSGRE